MEALTKEELKSLSVEKLCKMTEEQLNEIANMVIEKLNEYEIEELPKEVRNILQIEREGFWSKNTWITIFISALVMSLVQIIMGK